MKKFFISIFALILIITSITCKKTNSVSSNNNSQDTTKPQPTAVGTPVGSPTSKVIGTNGGTIISADSSVELDIPAGALSKDTTITIQPITNNCPGGIISAFRFSPNGLQFSQPATLKFHYPDSILQSTIAGLMGIAVQDSSGIWKAARKVTNDTIAHTIAASIKHFTDYSPMELIRLSPYQPAVKVNEEDPVDIEVWSYQDVQETNGENDDLFLEALVSYSGPPVIWTVNGVANGNSQYGTINSHSTIYDILPTGKVYKAPSTIPANNNPVTISATINLTLAYNDQVFNKITVYTHILIVDAQYFVQLYYEADSVNESGTYWNITDSAWFDVFTNSSSGTMSHPLNWDASVNFLYNNGTCTVTHGPSAAGPIHVLDSGTVAVDPINKEITVVFTKALIPSYYVPFPSWNYTCGSDQGTLGGGLGPPFPSYLQFGMMDIPGTEETIIITPQYKMVVTRE